MSKVSEFLSGGIGKMIMNQVKPLLLAEIEKISAEKLKKSTCSGIKELALSLESLMQMYLSEDDFQPGEVGVLFALKSQGDRSFLICIAHNEDMTSTRPVYYCDLDQLIMGIPNEHIDAVINKLPDLFLDNREKTFNELKEIMMSSVKDLTLKEKEYSEDDLELNQQSDELIIEGCVKCPRCESEDVALFEDLWICGNCNHEWNNTSESSDQNNNELTD